MLVKMGASTNVTHKNLLTDLDAAQECEVKI
jgi:hypothetical protein